jgi:hypothetical protein
MSYRPLSRQFAANSAKLGTNNVHANLMRPVTFAELQLIEEAVGSAKLAALAIESERVTLLVHSGSRAFGEAVLWAHVDRWAADEVQCAETLRQPGAGFAAVPLARSAMCPTMWSTTEPFATLNGSATSRLEPISRATVTIEEIAP